MRRSLVNQSAVDRSRTAVSGPKADEPMRFSRETRRTASVSAGPTCPRSKRCGWSRRDNRPRTSKPAKCISVLTRATADLASFRSAPAAAAPDGSRGLGRLEVSMGAGRVDTLPSRRVYYLAVNHRDPLLGGSPEAANLRRLIAHAIPRDAILTSCFRAGFPDHHHALDGPFPPRRGPAIRWQAASMIPDWRAHSPPVTANTKLELKYPADDPAVERACQQIQQSLSEYKIAIRLAPRSPADLRKQVTIDTDFQLAYCQHDFADDWYDVGGWLDPRRIGPPGRLGDRNFMSYSPSPDFASLLAAHAGASRLRRIARGHAAIAPGVSQGNAVHSVVESRHARAGIEPATDRAGGDVARSDRAVSLRRSVDAEVIHFARRFRQRQANPATPPTSSMCTGSGTGVNPFRKI